MHQIIYSNPSEYCGWPANHGLWKWDDELLVGFMSGRYKSNRLHNIRTPYHFRFARSLDAGLTWTIEEPAGIDWQCLHPADPPGIDWDNPDLAIRLMGFWDHGGDDVPDPGGWFLSYDRGRSWQGPYAHNGLSFGGRINTSRTNYLTDRRLLFMTDRRVNAGFGTDRAICVHHDGTQFKLIGVIAGDDDRAAMPSAVEFHDALYVAVRCRSRKRKNGWIDLHKSTDGGKSWAKWSEVAVTGARNGNPPALCVTNDRLYCAYANRSDGWLWLADSTDGIKWDHWVLRDDYSAIGRDNDMGYPQLVATSRGLICIYYWATKARPQQHIAATCVR